MTLNESLERILKPDPFAQMGEDQVALPAQLNLPADYLTFVREGWNSYGNGLLRFMLPGQNPPLGIWNQPDGWGQEWGLWFERYIVFGHDWQGRLLGFDLQRLENGEPLVSMLDTATGKALNSKSTFRGFIEFELATRYGKLLDEPLLKEWLASGGAIPQPDQCVGFKVPLSLGGKDTNDNLEITDLEVYLSLQGQILMST